jgi:hypothetical protein
MSAPGNANARRQPGERAIKLTDAPTLRRRVRHVNASFREAELGARKARRALREFAKTVTEARKVFAAPRSGVCERRKSMARFLRSETIGLRRS